MGISSTDICRLHGSLALLVGSTAEVCVIALKGSDDLNSRLADLLRRGVMSREYMQMIHASFPLLN